MDIDSGQQSSTSTALDQQNEQGCKHCEKRKKGQTYCSPCKNPEFLCTPLNGKRQNCSGAVPTTTTNIGEVFGQDNAEDGGTPASSPNELIRLLLSGALNDRSNTAGAEQLLRRVLAEEDPQVQRVLGREPELNYIDAARNEHLPNYVQCYLELLIGKKKLRLATFGGEGTTPGEARDDASWQALEFLYIFGGFAPSTTNDEDENNDEANQKNGTEEIEKKSVADGKN